MMNQLFIIFGFFVVYSFGECPNGFIQFYTDPTLCFSFQSNKTDFINAEGICINLGGHLASVHNMFENLFISEKARLNFTDSTLSDFWIGANTLITPGIWSWMDGTSFDFSDWENAQPQNVSNCGAVIIQGEKWISADCDKQKPFVCLIHVRTEMSSQPSTTTTTATTTSKITTTTSHVKACLPLWSYNPSTGFCYKVFENMNWLDAEKYCNSYGSHLASIHSNEEAMFIADLAYYDGCVECTSGNQVFVGLHTEDDNAHWQWTDGTFINWENWGPNEPNNPGMENCVELRLANTCGWAKGNLNNYGCDRLNARFICKKTLE